MEANKVSAIMKRSVVRSHIRCSASVAMVTLLVREAGIPTGPFREPFAMTSDEAEPDLVARGLEQFRVSRLRWVTFGRICAALVVLFGIEGVRSGSGCGAADLRSSLFAEVSPKSGCADSWVRGGRSCR